MAMKSVDDMEKAVDDETKVNKSLLNGEKHPPETFRKQQMSSIGQEPVQDVAEHHIVQENDISICLKTAKMIKEHTDSSSAFVKLLIQQLEQLQVQVIIKENTILTLNKEIQDLKQRNKIVERCVRICTHAVGEVPKIPHDETENEDF